MHVEFGLSSGLRFCQKLERQKLKKVAPSILHKIAERIFTSSFFLRDL